MRSRLGPVLLIHGGAGARRPPARQLQILAHALQEGFSRLEGGESALRVVEVVVRQLEESGLFNAGIGARLQLDGLARRDAALMEGRWLRAGAVAALEGTTAAIAVARLVLETTPHCLMTGPGATKLAKAAQLSEASPPPPSVSKRLVHELERVRRQVGPAIHLTGTVGAVALDRQGDVAAGTSTGGSGAMLPGRIGDSPLIGCGLYADNASGAVSCTGVGEGIIRTGLAREICLLIEQGASPQAAVKQALRRLVRRVDGTAGVLVVSHQGQAVILHTTPWMCAGVMTARRLLVRPRFQRIAR